MAYGAVPNATALYRNLHRLQCRWHIGRCACAHRGAGPGDGLWHSVSRPLSLRCRRGEPSGINVAQPRRCLAEILFIGMGRSEEHPSELQSLMRISYDVFCLKKKTFVKTRKNTV